MKALVTGGAGFIGSHVVSRLLHEGWEEVIVIDNESAESNEEFYWYTDKEARNYQYDIADYDNTRPLYDSVDVVFHLAAEARIQPAIKNPLLAVKTNALGTATVLQCAREAGVKRVLYSSTSSAYGLVNEPPLTEDMREDCLNPYSVSKVAGEKLCKMYYELFGLETVIFRYFNVYGDRQPLKGEYAPVVGLFLEQAKRGEPLTIVGDGEQRRDFTHVSDVVEANYLMATKDLPLEAFGRVYNVGTGINYSVNQIADMISDNQVHIPPRKGESRITLAGITRLCHLGWKPKYTIEDYIKTNTEN